MKPHNFECNLYLKYNHLAHNMLPSTLGVQINIPDELKFPITEEMPVPLVELPSDDDCWIVMSSDKD